MAKIDFNEFNAGNQSRGESGGKKDYSVKFFSIQDGESAIVRIMVDSTKDFDIHSVHRVKMPGSEYGRNVNCINEDHNPSSCPLCAANVKLEQKLFLRMLQYKVVDNQVEVTPVVWERSVFDKVFGAQKLVNYLTDYGPLSDIICKITRNGTGLKTTYSCSFALNIMPNTKNVYRDDIYVKQEGLFGDFSVLNVSVLNKSYDELAQFLATGSFPEVVRQSAPTPTDADAPAHTAPNYVPNVTSSPAVISTGYIPNTPNEYVPANVQSHPEAEVTPRTYTPSNTSAAPWDNSTSGFNRPRRYN